MGAPKGVPLALFLVGATQGDAGGSSHPLPKHDDGPSVMHEGSPGHNTTDKDAFWARRALGREAQAVGNLRASMRGAIALTEWPLLVVRVQKPRLACGPCSGAKQGDVFRRSGRRRPRLREEMHTVGSSPLPGLLTSPNPEGR